MVEGLRFHVKLEGHRYIGDRVPRGDSLNYQSNRSAHPCLTISRLVDRSFITDCKGGFWVTPAELNQVRRSFVEPVQRPKYLHLRLSTLPFPSNLSSYFVLWAAFCTICPPVSRGAIDPLLRDNPSITFDFLGLFRGLGKDSKARSSYHTSELPLKAHEGPRFGRKRWRNRFTFA